LNFINLFQVTNMFKFITSNFKSRTPVTSVTRNASIMATPNAIVTPIPIQTKRKSPVKSLSKSNLNEIQGNQVTQELFHSFCKNFNPIWLTAKENDFVVDFDDFEHILGYTKIKSPLERLI
jgi:hypothetical protein